MQNDHLIIPQNGLYLTRRDNDSFSEIFADNYKAGGWKVGEKAVSLTFVVTESCNLACTYCYERHKTGKKMKFETAKKAIDKLLSGKDESYMNFKEKPCLILEFIGGEPLLEIELINQITEYFKETAFALNHPWSLYYMISISTNGVLYFEPKVQAFLKKNAGKVSLGISVDGDKALHDTCRVFHDGLGSYDLAAKAAKDLLLRNPRATTKATVSPENVNQLFRAIKSLREEIGFHFIYCNCVFEEGWTLEHAKVFYAQLKLLADYILDNDLHDKFYISLFEETVGQEPNSESEEKNWCGGNGDMLAIDCDGNYFPCLRFMKFSLENQEEQSIGDLDNGFLITPKQREWVEKIKGITMKTQSNDECNSCPVREGCAICLGYNYDKFGDPNHRADFICIMHKARVCANAYYWNKLYKKLGLEKEFAWDAENIFEERNVL